MSITWVAFALVLDWCCEFCQVNAYAWTFRGSNHCLYRARLLFFCTGVFHVWLLLWFRSCQFYILLFIADLLDRRRVYAEKLVRSQGKKVIGAQRKSKCLVFVHFLYQLEILLSNQRPVIPLVIIFLLYFHVYHLLIS